MNDKTTENINDHREGKSEFNAVVITRITKLLTIYEEKISNCDELIWNLRFNKKQHCHNNNEIGYEECRKEIDIKLAQRQAYIQAKEDIDTIFDFLPDQPKAL